MRFTEAHRGAPPRLFRVGMAFWAASVAVVAALFFIPALVFMTASIVLIVSIIGGALGFWYVHGLLYLIGIPMVAALGGASYGLLFFGTKLTRSVLGGLRNALTLTPDSVRNAPKTLATAAGALLVLAYGLANFVGWRWSAFVAVFALVPATAYLCLRTEEVQKFLATTPPGSPAPRAPE